jgi:protein arginine N-methyltransferase 2
MVTEYHLQIDDQIQSIIRPISHIIIEAHPDVLSYMRHTGWYEKPGVTVLEGRWQDLVESDALVSEGFDIIYTDTFSEQYGGG